MRRPRIHDLAYRADSGARFAALAGSPWSVFLDSGGQHGERGRYDIFSAHPYATFTTRGQWTEIQTAQTIERTPDDPFQIIKKYLGRLETTPSGLPFAGGAMGYFGYDLGRRIERLPAIAASDIDMPDMAVGLYDWAVVVDHLERRACLVSSGRDEKSVGEWDRIIERVEGKTPAASRYPFRVLSPISSNVDRRSYAETFQRIRRYIRDGDCYQVNLSQRFSARVEGDAWDAYRLLQEFNPAPFSAYLNLPDGAVLSSSPERFLRVRDGWVETRPVKGTRPRSPYKTRDQGLADELYNSAKDRAENLMIVDLLRNDLGKNCVIGSVQVPELFAVESFATVHHLVSTVTGRLGHGRHALDLLAGCFPGGSITGAPKLRAMEIIEELEPHRRGVYCGAIGYLGYDGAMDTNIAIRTLVLNRGWMHCWAGGGIVIDSSMEAEYQECLDKASAMLRLLAARELTHVGG